MTEATGSGVSLKPSDAQAGGGGLFDDLDVLLKSLRFRTWDYQGKIQTPVLGLEVVFERLDGEEAGTTFEQVYSAGDLKFLVPSPDGSEAVPVTKERTGLTEGTNALQFLLSIVNSGFPEHLIGQKVTAFAGVKAHVNRVPQQKRPGIAKAAGQSGKDDILVVTNILNKAEIQAGTYQTPGAAAAKPAAGKKAAAPKTAQAAAPVQAQAPAAATGGDAAVTDRAVEVLMEILAGKGGSIAKAAVAGEAFKILNAAKDPLRNQVSQLVFKDEFLSGGHGPWSFDGTTISLG